MGLAAIVGGILRIGKTVLGGTAGSVLFVDVAGDLGQDNANLFWDDASNYLGLGTNSPNEQLELTGNIRLEAITAGSTDGIIYKGALTFAHSWYDAGTTGRNTFLGVIAGNLTMGGAGSQASYNTGIGYAALQNISIGNHNVGLGAQSLISLTTGSQNLAVGSFSGGSVTTASGNMFMGYAAGLDTNGSRNVIVGSQAGRGDALGNDNVIIGNDGGRSLIGNDNILIGAGCTNQGVTVSGAIIVGKDIDATVDYDFKISQAFYGNIDTAGEYFRFQPTVDSTTFFQILDADGGAPVFNADTVSEYVGVGLNNPAYKFHVQWTSGVDAGFFRGTTDPDITGTFMRSPDGTLWYTWVDNAGAFQSNTVRP